MLVEARPFFTNPPVMYPSVFIANALAAFALNLVRVWLRAPVMALGITPASCLGRGHLLTGRPAQWKLGAPSRQPTSLLSCGVQSGPLNAAPPLQAVFLLIGKTSALTMNIAGVIKDWMLIFFSFYIFKAPVTRLNLFGYAFCCTGVAIYNYQKLQVRGERGRAVLCCIGGWEAKARNEGIPGWPMAWCWPMARCEARSRHGHLTPGTAASPRSVQLLKKKALQKAKDAPKSDAEAAANGSIDTSGKTEGSKE